jgi:hypothetical protein
MREHFVQGIGARMDVGRLFGKEIKKALFARQEPLQ